MNEVEAILNSAIRALDALSETLAAAITIESIELAEVEKRITWLRDGYRSQLPAAADTSATRPTPHAAVASAALTPDARLPGDVPLW